MNAISQIPPCSWGVCVLGWMHMAEAEGSIAEFIAFSLRLLALLGVVVALLVVVALVVALVSSIVRVTVGRATLVLPFSGSERAPAVGGVLIEQMPRVRKEWLLLSSMVNEAEETVSQGARSGSDLVDLPPSRSDEYLQEDQFQVVLDTRREGTGLGEISFAGMRFSPDMLFAAFHRLRRLVAQSTIRGTYLELGGAARLSCTLVGPRSSPLHRRPRNLQIETRVVVCQTEPPQKVLDAIDNMAFLLTIAALRMGGKGLDVGALTWGGYRAFMQAYASHQEFASTGNLQYREMAIDRYREAIEAEPGYTLAHYNLGTLLYNRYTASDNEATRVHLKKAAASPDQETRALSLAALAMAYCQQVHRFGHPATPWGYKAVAASAEAYSLKPSLEQTSLARGFAYQVLGQAKEALAWYRRVLKLPLDSPEDQRLHSYANNNMGYIFLRRPGHQKRNLAMAERHFRKAIELFPQNKMTWTNLGEIHRIEKDYSQALADYAKAVEIDPRYVSAFNETGFVYLAKAKDSDNPQEEADFLACARDCHLQAISIIEEKDHRHRAETHRRFAEFCSDQGFPGEAKRWEAEAAGESKFLTEAKLESSGTEQSLVALLRRSLLGGR
jgi:tetratricopeptide (TPR) repeat protein